MVAEEQKGVFVGKETIMICNYRREDDNILIKKTNRFFPLMADWRPALGNLRDHLKNYTELTLFDGNHGRTDEKVRVFFFDADTLEPFDPGLNLAAKRELKTLKAERDYLYHSLLDMQQTLKQMGLFDQVKKRAKELMDFSRNISPFRPVAAAETKKKGKK